MKHMKRLLLGAVLVLIAFTPAVMKTAAMQTGTPASGSADPNRALVSTYCYGCHNTRAKMGGLALDELDTQPIGAHPDVWEKAVRKLRGRLMPPPGSKQPEQPDVDKLVSYLETSLDAVPNGPNAGYVPIQRMNRTEYAAAVKALVGVDVNLKEVLPVDDKIGNLDNIAAALSVSPSFVDQYVAAARKIAKHAVGDPSLEDETYKLSQNRGGEGMPLGIRDNSGFRMKLNFPVDGEYRFSILFPDQVVGLYLGSLENESTIVFMIDGKIMFKKPIGGLADLTLNNRKAGDGRQQIVDRFKKVAIPVQAGVHDVVIGYIERSRFESTDALGGGGRGGGGNYPNLGDIEIAGPYKPTGAVSAPGRAMIFVCDPKTAGEAPCAKQIAQNLAKRAYRRPVTDADVARLIPFYEAGRKEGGNFDQGVQRLVSAVLVSPDFLYRAIRGPEGTKPNTEFVLTDLELASRLSFFLWNAPPDDELLNLAIGNGLNKPAVLDAQVKRMLRDPRASSLASSFAMKWLSLDDLDTVTPDPNLFGQFNDALRQDFSREVESFISSILLEDHSVVDLLTSKSTFVNQRLAQHYGIQGVTGAQFRKIELTDERRFGLLGKAAVLLRTSYPDRTSPVLRGAWILGRLQGTPPTPPPPTVENQDLAQKQGEAPKTVRERLEKHRDNATCRQCHGVIDPMGLALENFDAIGRFRTNDAQANNALIDASSVLPNGIAINGINELRLQLASRPAVFAQAFSEKLMMYAINRELDYFDMPQVRAVVRGAAKDNYTLSSLVLGIVHSDAFRKQGPAPASKAVAANSK